MLSSRAVGLAGHGLHGWQAKQQCMGGRPSHSWCLHIPAVQRQWALQGMQRLQGKARLGFLMQQPACWALCPPWWT